MSIRESKREALEIRRKELHILKKDVAVSFIRGSGRGGQKVNVSSTCVQLIHAPTNIVIRCQETRSREDNLFHAWRRLIDQIEKKERGSASRVSLKQAKIRKQKQKRKRRHEKKEEHLHGKKDRE